MPHHYSNDFLHLFKKHFFNADFVVHYSAFNMMCQGDVFAAQVLARILFWWRPYQERIGDEVDWCTNITKKVKSGDYAGRHALVKSATEMALELGLFYDTKAKNPGEPNDQKVRRAYNKLEELGFITIVKERWGRTPEVTYIILNESIFVNLFSISFMKLQIAKGEYQLKTTSKRRVKKREEIASDIEDWKDKLLRFIEDESEYDDIEDDELEQIIAKQTEPITAEPKPPVSEFDQFRQRINQRREQAQRETEQSEEGTEEKERAKRYSPQRVVKKAPPKPISKKKEKALTETISKDLP